jgi:ppGpp synthetase/RelA/SpoT-type nucleotidyltranferase
MLDKTVVQHYSCTTLSLHITGSEFMPENEELLRFIAEKIPPPYNTPSRCEEYIRRRIQAHDVTCTIVQAEVVRLLEPLMRQHAQRFFCRIDDSHKQKSATSIVGKIMRSKGEYDINNFTEKMTDIVRFRIVCNFLSDTTKVAIAITTSETLQERYSIRIEDSVNVKPTQRTSGERSVKFILEDRTTPGLFLEIQIVTQLQEAWDKKDHPLLYEPRRGDLGADRMNVPDYLHIRMFAMSELLYVADTFFDDLRSHTEDGETT